MSATRVFGLASDLRGLLAELEDILEHGATGTRRTVAALLAELGDIVDDMQDVAGDLAYDDYLDLNDIAPPPQEAAP